MSKDYTKAVALFRKAIDSPYPEEAMQSLGECYFYGTGVPQDESKAVEWYRKAAEGGDANGMFSLAWCLDHGRGVARDREAAVRWYRQASRKGSEHAKKALKALGLPE